jgi:tetratricopeptide (TPR) repeat protein
MAGRFLAACASLGLPAIAPAQELDLGLVFDQRKVEPMKELLSKGDYANVAKLCSIFIENGQPSPDWWIMRVQAGVALGAVDDIVATTESALQRHKENLRVLMTCHEALTAFGKTELAAKVLQQVNTAAKGKPASRRTTHDLLSLGRAALAAGADPQKVMQQFYDPAKKKEDGKADACLALGELALSKSDYARAANEFREGLKHRSADPELRFGLARAYAPSDRKRSGELVDQILEGNPNHPGALLLRAEQYLGAEQFDEARLSLEDIFDVCPQHPEAWALRAVIAVVADNREDEAVKCRGEGLKLWDKNPVVDTTIGRCLSRSYRFREAADHLQAAVKLDEKYLPAKVHLCHAYFRLGRENEAWTLAKEIQKADAYNIQAYNIGLLEAEMKGFTVREDPDFVLKMPARDMAIYGERALELLRDAKRVLAPKYGLTLDHPVLVEFFPSQQDFAIRTFGNLGGQGILGACFGTVVTMNSPGSIASNRSNWESTLWHEFCHVITLTVTKNRMPRWLSEGISVHEEAQRDPSWGMRMTADYRRFTLDEETLTPMSRMSAAFLGPKSGDHLMFAYYESSQAVEWLIKNYGVEKFQAVLKDLAEGRRINEALQRNCAEVAKLDEAFAKHMRELAEVFSPKGDWEKPDPDEVDPRDEAAVAAYLREHPENLWALEKRIQRLMAGENWKEALELAQRLIALVPENTGRGSGYALAADAYRGLKQPAEEAAMLREWAKRDGGADVAFLRLIDLDTQLQNWDGARENARRMFAIHPFLKHPYEVAAKACETKGDADGAVWALNKLSYLGPNDPVEVNFALARLLQSKDRETAKRRLLDALMEAPRFRDGHKLLLQLQTTPATTTTP